MKAIVHSHYGPPDNLRYEEIARPAAKDDEVLIRIRAASVNPLDYHVLRGTPYAGRIVIGLRKPRSTQLGADVAGVVEAVGANVTKLRPGDKVFGVSKGAFAEYAATKESAVALKPPNLTFEEAAAVPVAAYTALQALRNKANVQAGQKVLINGAAGGVGTFAVQLAKLFGAEVTAVCSTHNVEMLRSLGADRVIDYTSDQFTKDTAYYDAFLDNISNHSLSQCRRVLKPKGIYVAIGGPLSRFFSLLFQNLFASQTLAPFLARGNPQDLNFLRELLETGKIKPVIDRRYPLREVPEALRYLEQGHARGKVVITA